MAHWQCVNHDALRLYFARRWRDGTVTEALKLVASECAAACRERVESMARSHDRHWWAGVGLYLWTAFLFGNVMGEIWRLFAAPMA